MTISDDLRQLSAAIDYLSQKRKDILDDLKARPERHGCPYFIGQVFKTQGGTFYKVEQIDNPDLSKRRRIMCLLLCAGGKPKQAV